MLWIVIGHCAVDFYPPWEISDANLLIRLVSALTNAGQYGLAAGFFMICGYGLRKRSVKQTAKQLLGYLWKPYLLVALACVLGEAAKKYLTHGSIVTALRYTGLTYLLGFCPSSDNFLGLQVGFIGPVWFFLVYVLAGILLSAVLQIDGFWPQCAVVAGLSACGLLLGDVPLPWCLQQTMICTGFLFAGYYMKRLKFLSYPFPKWLGYMIIAIAALFSLRGRFIDVSWNTWSLGALPAVYLSGVLCVRLLYLLGGCKENPVTVFLNWCGINAMPICCIHTVAYKVIPWHRLVERFSGQKLLGLAIETAVQLFIALFGSLVIMKYRQWKRIRQE